LSCCVIRFDIKINKPNDLPQLKKIHEEKKTRPKILLRFIVRAVQLATLELK